jgi:two-component system sensor kinase FixL
MTKAGPSKEADASKTKQQLVDELNSLRQHVRVLEQSASTRQQNLIATTLQSRSEPSKVVLSQLASILQISSDAIISIDKYQQIQSFSQGAEQIFGYESREIVGKSLKLLLPEQVRGVHKKYVEEYAQSGGDSRLMGTRAEIMGQRRDGSKFPAKASISKFISGENVVLTVVLQDISELRKTEAAVSKHRKELAHVNRLGLLNEVSASLAHELNQPLTAILTNSQILQKQCHIGSLLPEDGDEIINDLVNDARRAAGVIQQLKSMLNKEEVPKDTLDVNHMVNEVEYLLHSELLLRHISISLELAPDLPFVFGNKIQLQQVLLNIMVNAMEAMETIDPGDRRLLIRTHQVEPAMITISLKDSGVGFDAKLYEKLNEPFYTTKNTGMGMGLAISQTITASHGGQLHATNNKGSGATFHLTLPGTVLQEVVEDLAEDVQPTKQDSTETMIFLIDDDLSVLKAMNRLIKSSGYLAETFLTAEAFLKREPYTGYGCIVADLHMPGISGIDLQRELNKLQYTMPIIFVTGAGDTSSGVTAMKQGAMDFLIKPVDHEKLLNLVDEAVELDRRNRDQYTRRTSAREKLAKLTSREAEVMELVVKGRMNKQIAHEMGISEKTVKAHRGRAMRKLEVRSVAKLVHIYESFTVTG